MELFQVFWDDQKRLFLEFEKREDEREIFVPENIRYINIQFEISKMLDQGLFRRGEPILLSIKKVYYTYDMLSFPIDLDEFRGVDDLQIKLLQLIIQLHNGYKLEYNFTEKIRLSDLWINEDCYDGYQFGDLNSRKKVKSIITHAKLIQEIQTDHKNNTQKNTILIEKESIESISDSNPENSSLISMIRENNETLKIIANELKNLTTVLKHVSLNGGGGSYLPSGPPVRRNSNSGIERIKNSPSRSAIVAGGSPTKALVIREMKEVFQKTTTDNSEFDIRKILKPMTEKELQSITLSEENLREKEEIAIQNQIKRLENKQSEDLSLENLKQPK
jgi:hypothetical protein